MKYLILEKLMVYWFEFKKELFNNSNDKCF